MVKIYITTASSLKKTWDLPCSGKKGNQHVPTVKSESQFLRFNNNAQRDSLLIGVFNSSMSIFSGFVVFTILGFLANQTGTTVDKAIYSF